MGALNIELDILNYGYDSPAGQSFVRIWGIPLQEIAQASNLNMQNIQVYGGMQKGLPLANPAQAGLLVQGQIQQAFGNYISVNQTLDLIVVAGYASASAPGGTGSPEASADIPFNWKAGVPLGTAIKNALATSTPFQEG